MPELFIDSYYTFVDILLPKNQPSLHITNLNAINAVRSIS